MKITKIRFENIHSLKGEYKIDFGEGILAEAGLFAITGPTGSGKSTLLDVITLALYNQMARVGQVSNRTLEQDGGIMTRNMKSCYAEVEYRVNGIEYRSHWSIERNRNNNLNARKQEVVEIATGTILESTTKVPEKNAEIIGLSYEQFSKAMVLSQGEFSKLLQAPRDARNKLLEDITGAKSYRQIGIKVFQRYSAVKKKLELKEAGLENIELLSPEIISERKTELKTLIESKPEVDKAFQTASEKIKIREELQKRKEEEKELKSNFEKLEEYFLEFIESQQKLEKHEKLSRYIPELQTYDILVKEVRNNAGQLKILKESKLQQDNYQKLYLQKIESLIKDTVEISNASEKLESFRSQIVQLQTQENSKKQEVGFYQKQTTSFSNNLISLGYTISKDENPEQFKVEVEVIQNKLQEVLNRTGLNSLEDLDIRLNNLRASSEKSSEFLNKKENSVRLQKNLETQKTNLKTGLEGIAENQKKNTVIEKETYSLEIELKTLTNSLEHQRKHQSLDQHRQQLEQNEPCPLCGSMDHPYAVSAPYFDVKEEQLKDLQNLLKTKTNLSIAYQQSIKLQTKNNESLKIEIEKLNFEEERNSKNLKGLGKELKWDYQDSLEILQSRRKELLSQIDQLENSKKAFQAKSIVKELKKSLHAWDLALKEYTDLKDKRVKLYSGNNIDQESNQLATNITKTSTSISSLEKQLSETVEKLTSNIKQESQKEAELEKIVANESLQSIEELKSNIVSEEEASKFRKRQTQLNEGKARLAEKESMLTKVLTELLEKDDKESSSEDLEKIFEENRTNRDRLSENIGKIIEVLENDNKTRLRQEAVLEEMKMLRKDLSLWKTMNDLIGDSYGNKFSNFVQDLTLEQLIGYANKRLVEFSDRYLLDIPTVEESDKSDTLKIFDKYMGNARRSVRTLSGGETFLVSLAMAFALSDIAARNVKIESLFIDEGFGTLDPETLDQAITILEKMQNEGDRSVGVISHVSALKERITTQIRLEKSSLGYSTIEIVQ